MRGNGLGRLVDGLKYRSMRAAAGAIAELMSGVLPCLPADMMVVPVPTNTRHVRERGLDHTWLMAKELARLRGVACKKVVRRVANTVQVGAGAALRAAQAERSYELAARIDPDRTYLVIDDVYTTGASLEAVCEVLRRGGAKKIWVAVLCRAED